MKISSLSATLILLGMFFLMFFSSINDSATFDEVAHIGAGFSYLKELDGRLNPEHPPLIKDLAALPLLFLNLRDSPVLNIENVNDAQWSFGNSLLYKFGNDADKILLFSRLPIMLLAVLFGWILFWWTRKNYGAPTAVGTLLLYALSPTFLAHSRYVTTDLGAAFAFFSSIIFFINFLEKNDKKSAIYFGLIFGLSLLIKFSLIILIPFFIILIIWKLIENWPLPAPLRLARPGKIENLVLASFIVLAIIYIFYIPQIWNYSTEQNLADAKFTIGGYKTAEFAPKIDFWLLKNKITQPLGQYLHGFLMAAQRTAGGNSAYFLGEVSNKGWIHYFPTLFITKEQIGLYILILFALITSFKNFKKPSLTTTTFLAFIAYYWAWSLWSPLNIGIRHILPTFPFIYILVSNSLTRWVFSHEDELPCPPNPSLLSKERGERRELSTLFLGVRSKKFFLATIFVWMGFEITSVFPYFISYYNELAGGWRVGYKIATDSNYDWGQDLKRLKKWVEENNVEKIYLDYFGGGSPKYYLGKKYEFWRYEKGPPPQGSYFAISANSLVGAEDLYYWLKDKKPVARAGSSIFIFKLP